MELSFTVMEVYHQSEYIMQLQNQLTFMKFKGTTYLVYSEVTGMGDSIKCDICKAEPMQNSGAVMVGSGQLLGIIMCPVCRTVFLCKFDDVSHEALIRSTEIERDLIEEIWSEELINQMKTIQ